MASGPASPDALLHLAALHALAQAGFASTSRAASLTLSAALSRYLRTVALTCTERAALGGRAKVAAVDVVQALGDMGVSDVEELHDWVSEAPDAGGVEWNGGLDGYEEYLREGVGATKSLADLRLVHQSALSVDSVEDEAMDVDADGESEDEIKPRAIEAEVINLLRCGSPNMSWLPPLPGGEAEAEVRPTSFADDPASAVPASANMSTAERYRRAIPFASSQLFRAHPWDDPPRPPETPVLPKGTTSFPDLIEAYEAMASEPSVALPQTNMRKQISDLMRYSVATADAFSPPDTLSSYFAPARVSPFVPSHSDTLIAQPIPLNPDPPGLLSSLVQQVNSPSLPPHLRERLTSIRPPNAQMRDAVPILYGDRVRGPDSAALARAKGKQPDIEDEGYYRATWDSGPRGVDKWGRGDMPTGKKVVQSRQGEEKPRQAERPPDDKKLVPAEGTKLRLRLGSGISPGAPGGGGEGTGSPGPPTQPSSSIGLTAPSPGGVTSAGGLRLKLNPFSKRENDTHSPMSAKAVSPNPPVTHGGVSPRTTDSSDIQHRSSSSSYQASGTTANGAMTNGITSDGAMVTADQIVNGDIGGEGSTNGSSSQVPEMEHVQPIKQGTKIVLPLKKVVL